MSPHFSIDLVGLDDVWSDTRRFLEPRQSRDFDWTEMAIITFSDEISAHSDLSEA